MAQPLPSPVARLTHGLPSHPHRKRKISAPPQLMHHLGGGSMPSTPSSQDLDNAGSTSTLSTVSNTPKPVRIVQFFPRHSNDNLFRKVSSDSLLTASQMQFQTDTNGLDNQSYVSNENLSSSIHIDNPVATNINPRDSTGSGSTIAMQETIGTSSQYSLPTATVNTPEYCRSTSNTSLISINFNNRRSTDSLVDSQSIFSYDGTPTVNSAEVFFSSSMESQDATEGHVIQYMDGTRSELDIEGNSKTQSDSHTPTATEPAKRKEWLVSTLSTNMSIVYILFLIVTGIVIYLQDMFDGEHSVLAEAFNLYLMSAEILWLMYIHLDVRRYVGCISKLLKKAGKDEGDIERKKESEANEACETSGQNSHKEEKTLPQDYGFTFSSHGGSLYLKIGATVFCIGHLILTGLEVATKLIYLTHDDPDYRACTSLTDVIMSIMQLGYIFYKLFFVFKFSNLIINKRMVISKFGLMHCIGSSLCFWLYTIIQETLLSLSNKKSDYDNDNYGNATTPQSVETLADADERRAMKLYLGCEQNTAVSGILNDAAPYLYPFSIEFNILIVGFWILLWENLGKIEKHRYIPSIEVTYEEDNSRALASNLIIYVDCHASSRGLFAGLFITIISVLSIILFFVFSSSDSTLDKGLLIHSTSEILVLSFMLITTIVAFYYIRRLDVLSHKISSADDILLYVCLPFVFLYSFFIMVPYALEYNSLYVADNVLKVLQVILQTALIVDGLRRCSNTHELRHTKPGREVIIFLVVTNVAMWLLMSFQIINTDGNAVLYDFYGKEVWTAVSHLTLPLSLFYRFHSSVCLVDIWKVSYEQEPEH